MSASSLPPLATPPAAVRIFEAKPPLPGAALETLRFFTAGSVDDGKSTLIGRLLYDADALMQDHIQALQAASRGHGERLNLALVTDGLRAEREQNITIDVAYRYFATPRRRFIVADTPGHAQYTRNTISGASHASLALLLLDATRGLLPQTRRHACLAALLGIRHMVVAVNKIDLVDYAESAFRALSANFGEWAGKLEIPDLVFIPVSALHGDNVVERSSHTPWYQGPTLLHHLESVNLALDRNLQDFRFPVQLVIHHAGRRWLAGRIASGAIRPGEEVVALPSRQSSTVRTITGPNGPVPEAGAGEAITLTLEDDLDVGRGAMLARSHNQPHVTQILDVTLCWLSESPLDPALTYTLQQTTCATSARVRRIDYRLDPETLHRQPAATLECNEIARVQLSASQPLCVDPFQRNPVTGALILVEPSTHATVAAGVIRAAAVVQPSPRLESLACNIPRLEREARNRHRAGVVWFTGLPASGKSSLACALERRLFDAGCSTMLLDGDQLRQGVCAGLGFSYADRTENIRRAGEVARLLFEHGAIVLCAFVSPFRQDRDWVRSMIGPDYFLEVYLDCALEECRRRDPKRLYADAASGTLTEMTGIAQPYQPPLHPGFTARSQLHSPGQLADQLLDLLRHRGWLPAPPLLPQTAGSQPIQETA